MKPILIYLASFFLAPISNKDLMTWTVVGPELIIYQLSSEQHSVEHHKACSDVFDVFISTTCGSGVYVNKAELCHRADDAQMHRGCRL